MAINFLGDLIHPGSEEGPCLWEMMRFLADDCGRGVTDIIFTRIPRTVPIWWARRLFEPMMFILAP